MFFTTDIKYLKGVGEARAKLLGEEFDIHTFRDLAYCFPFRHVDRSRFYHIRDFSGEMPLLQIRGRFRSFETVGEGARQRLMGLFDDGDRLMLVVWFARVRDIQKAYTTGVEYILFGKPQNYQGNWQMVHPEVTRLDPENLPKGFWGVYNLTEKARKKGYTPKTLGRIARNLIDHPGFATVPDTLPEEVRREYHLMPLADTIRNLHFPDDSDSLQCARERMKFEELFYLQLNILRYARERSVRIKGIPFPTIGEKFNRYYSECIPFQLTGAQKRVLREIRADMRYGRQMNRLIQGDVGSGKTMVAFMSMLMAVDNGCQGALMAPTEILASQHYETLSEWGEKIGLRVELLTGSTRSKKRREVLAGLADGSIHIVVGTHALIEDTVVFHRLGLAVIDEQHRFGVAQRARMWKKGEVAPHVLVMTATPIPRTLAMTVYGDLDVSVIDELPPGRKPVETYLRYDNNRMEVNRLLGRELAAGRQVYVVYPLIAENPKLELKSVETGFERIRGLFPQYETVCVHGRMKADVKEANMQRFVSGEARILVATTVIEVGVNVPNASVMLIENAERFGLSQLHQLRGRVGRGSDRSYCILVTKAETGGDTKKRLQIMADTSDGFLISEADMRLRGPGDMEGTQQSGLAFNLQVANLATDGQILNIARECATRILDAHPELLERPAASSADDAEQNGARGNAGEAMHLSQMGVATLRSELHYRFAKTINWSQIS